MKAFILSAGLGTRLRPVTNFLPKALVPIDGKPLLQYWLENLTGAGVDQFLINVHYKSETIKAFLVKSTYKHMVKIVKEDFLLNTGGSLLSNKDFFDRDPFMLIHGDNLCLCDFREFIAAHKKRPSGCVITMMLFYSDNPVDCGIVELDEQGIVRQFHEKVKNPPSNLANAAVYICEYSIFSFLEDLNKRQIDFSNDVLPNYLGKISTYINTSYHRDIGTIESYALAQVEILQYK